MDDVTIIVCATAINRIMSSLKAKIRCIKDKLLPLLLFFQAVFSFFFFFFVQGRKKERKKDNVQVYHVLIYSE